MKIKQPRIQRYISIVPNGDKTFLSFYFNRRAVYRDLAWTNTEAFEFYDTRKTTLEDELTLDESRGYTIIINPDEIDRLLMLKELIGQ